MKLGTSVCRAIMGEMFEKARVFVKNITDVFGKAGGERSKCPRCKGTGLNSGRHGWNWNQPPPTTDSCWFCEGVGVMPIAGVNGFMVGRSKPVINTNDVIPRPELPIKMQLYLGKYPETKCTINTHGPSLKLADLVYDPNQVPSWMNAVSGEGLRTDVEGFDEQLENGLGSCISTSSAGQSSKPSKLLVSQTGISTSNRIRVSVSPVSTKHPNLSTGRISQESHYKGLYSQASLASPPIEQRTNRRVGPAPRRINGSLLVTVRKTVCTALSAPMFLSPVSPVRTSTRYNSFAHSKSGESQKTRGLPVLRTPRSARVPRRERNRVREEAEKEAVQRARKLQKPSTSESEQRSAAVPDPCGSRQSGIDRSELLDNLSNDCLTSQNPWRRIAMSSRRVSSDLTAINRLVVGKVKDGIMRTPALGKAF